MTILVKSIFQKYLEKFFKRKSFSLWFGPYLLYTYLWVCLGSPESFNKICQPQGKLQRDKGQSKCIWPWVLVPWPRVRVSDQGFLVQGKKDFDFWSGVRPWSLVTGTWFLDPGSGFVSLTMGTWPRVREILSLGWGLDLGCWSLVLWFLAPGQKLVGDFVFLAFLVDFSEFLVDFWWILLFFSPPPLFFHPRRQPVAAKICL